MFDVGFWELALIGVVALLIVGPQRLPSVIHNVALWVGKIRGMVRDAKAEFSRELREHNVADIETLKRDIEDAGGQFKDTTSDLNEATGMSAATDSIQQTWQGRSTTKNQNAQKAKKNTTTARSTRKTKTKSTSPQPTRDKQTSSQKPTPRYYLYQNLPQKYTSIHVGTCGHCNNGKGRAPGSDPQYIKWHKPVATLEMARQKQNALDGHKKECRCVSVAQR